MKRSILIDHNIWNIGARIAVNSAWPQFINDGQKLRQCNNFREAMNAIVATETRRAAKLFDEFMSVSK